MTLELDPLDQLASKAFESFVVRKDLVRSFAGQYSVPTYVVEFLLGKYCATTDPEEITEGLEIVQRQLADRAVRADEYELFKKRAREEGSVTLIDIITTRLDTKTDSYLATLPSLQLNDVRIGSSLANKHERMFTGGFYAEMELGYDAVIAEEKDGRPFGINRLNEIQISQTDVLRSLCEGRNSFSTGEWKDFMLRSIGFEPAELSDRARDILFLRLVPFVERNYNAVELGPRGTGKSHLFQQISPYSHLVSGGKATVAQMFVNNATGHRGLVCQYDVVCFDEVSGVSFDQKDGVNILKGYMESGEFSRGKESIRGEAGIILVGNFQVDVEHQQRIGHLFQPLPREMRDDTAFMDRIHAYIPGWDIPSMDKQLFTDHFGLVSDFLSECFSKLRQESRIPEIQGRVEFGGALRGRDVRAAQKTISGLLKLISPDREAKVPDEDLEWAVRIALEARRRVKEQQKRIGAAEFRSTNFSYVLGSEGVEKFVATPELYSDNSVTGDPLPAGQVWTLSPGGYGSGNEEENPGLFRIEANEGPGSGVKILNKPAPKPFQESVKCAEQNLYTHATDLVGEREPRQHEFNIQLRAYDAAKSGTEVSVAVALALCSSLLDRPIRGGLVAVGMVNLGGSLETVNGAVNIAELAVEKGARKLLIPVAARHQLMDMPDDLATRVDIIYYKDLKDALVKAIED